jgi:non-ribosomal peptide synthetase component F
MRGLRVSVREAVRNGSAKFDLNIIVIPGSEARTCIDSDSDMNEIALIWEYNSGLFEAITIQRMIKHYEQLLEIAVSDEDLPVGRLRLLEGREAAIHLGGGNEHTPFGF